MLLRRVITTFFCVFILSLFMVLMLCSVTNITIPVSGSAEEKTRIVIDAGHGGEDGGAVSDSGVAEKDINLSVANNVSDMFRLLGYEVVQTRDSDNDLSDGEATTRERKVSDMKKRLEIFESDPSNTVISIHQNKFTESKYHGTQVFYSPNNADSSRLAEGIRFSVKSLLQPENERECKTADSGIYLLKNTRQPAVIVECGFISNKEELEKLLDEKYQKKLALAIATGVLDYKHTDLEV